MTTEDFRKECECKAELLCQKVRKEFDAYIDVVRRDTVDGVIASAHEIADKDNICEWLNTRNLPSYLTMQQTDALLKINDTLEELYQTLIDTSASGGEYDIEYTVTSTADYYIDKEKENKEIEER